ncbi:MAG: glucan-binding protein [Bacteroidota bacterium]
MRFSFAISFFFALSTILPAQNQSYTTVIEGFDWGAAVSKVIVPIDSTIQSLEGADFEVSVTRSTDCAEMNERWKNGERKVMYAYTSDAQGKRTEKGKFATLVLFVAPFEGIGSPMQYFANEKCPGNAWVDYNMRIIHKKSQRIWRNESYRMMPLVDQFDVSRKYIYKDGRRFAYADFKPTNKKGKSPLVIWLHGGGEGGNDPTVALMANRAANYAAPEIQAYFGGAYVLVPQCPGAWMHNTEGRITWGAEDDVYHKPLMALIKDYVKRHPNIDEDRIYLGGCFNGGYMTIKLMLEHPDYFAAGFPSALAYKSEYLSDAQIKTLSKQPIWFIHSEDDPVTPAATTVVPVYERLMKANAKNIHFSYFDHVVDITRVFGGENYHYNGHFSWIYSHTNNCFYDYDGQPVLVDEKPVSLMEWMAAQKREK